MFFPIRTAIGGRKYEFEDLGVEDYSLSLNKDTLPTMPLSLRLKQEGGEYWQLPWEPILHVSGGNNIVKRYVAKAKHYGGSIKERWAQDDWEVEIEGYFMNADGLAYPRAAVEKLKTICEARDVVEVEHEGLLSLGITSLVIEDFDFPFSSGPENQSWRIKAYSDKDWKLLETENG